MRCVGTQLEKPKTVAMNCKKWLRSFDVVLLLVPCCLAPDIAASPLDDLQPGHWYEVPNSALEKVFPSPAPRGNTGPRSVMDAWSGGAYDTRRDRLIVWGGGHLDYSGNELYAFDVRNLAWMRITEPTADNQVVPDAVRYADSRPSSRHTYNYIQYSPEMDALVSLGVAASYGDHSSDRNSDSVDAFNFDSGSWEIKVTKPANGFRIGSISAHDALTGKLWHHGCLSDEAGLVAYDHTTDTWSGPYGQHYVEYYATAAIDPSHHVMVATGGAKNNKVLVWDLNHPGSPREPRTTGPKTLESAQAPGFVYDPAIGKFVGWAGGASVYILDPDSWEWRRIDAASTNTVVPTAPNENGTYGRFRYVPSENAFILVNRADENVYLYKLSNTFSHSKSVRASNVNLVRGGGAVDSWTVLLLVVSSAGTLWACGRCRRGLPVRRS